jgi:hypothetical protein
MHFFTFFTFHFIYNNVTAYNAYCLYKFKGPECVKKYGNKRCRRILQEKLCISLIEPQIKIRFDSFSEFYFQGLQFEIINSFKQLGFKVKYKEAQNSETLLKSCQFCINDKNMSKHRTFCNEYGKTFCKMHGHLLMK